jgi:hypothetical protein
MTTPVGEDNLQYQLVIESLNLSPFWRALLQKLGKRSSAY